MPKRGQAISTMLFESDWRHIASSPIQGTPNTIDIYAKNGRILVVEEYGPQGENGVEFFYPSSQRTLTDLMAEANAYAMHATITIETNKVG